MANQSEKKRLVKERKVGGYYTLACAASLALWLLKLASDFLRGKPRHSKLGCLWRLALLLLGYGASLYSILNNLRLGLQFSLSNDLFVVTTAAALLSLFSDLAYRLFLLVPLYGAYKGSVALYRWATAPAPEVPANAQPKEPKTRVRYRTVR